MQLYHNKQGAGKEHIKASYNLPHLTQSYSKLHLSPCRECWSREYILKITAKEPAQRDTHNGDFKRDEPWLKSSRSDMDGNDDLGKDLSRVYWETECTVED